MSALFRCRECHAVTRTPLEHSLAHGERSTVAQVWEGFALLAVGPDPRTPRVPAAQEETLPLG